MPKGFYTLNDFSGGLNSAMDPRDLAENEISEAENIVMDQRKSVRPLGGDTTHTDIGLGVTAGHITPGYGAFVFESDHEKVPALANEFGADELAFSQSGSYDTIVDDNSTFLTLGYRAGDIITITGCTDVSANNIAGLKIRSVTANTITLDHDGVLTNETNEAGDVTLTRIGGSVDTGENWLAVMDAKTATVDLYDKNGDAFIAERIDLGDIDKDIAGSSGTIDFPTTSTITDSANGFINDGIKKGDIIGITGCSSTTANNLNAVRVEKVEQGTITVEGTPFTVQASEGGTVTIHRLAQGVFYFADEALRVCDASFGSAAEPRWYGYVERTDFNGISPSTNCIYDQWVDVANTLAPPTDIVVHNTTYPSAGTGFNIKVASSTGGTYEGDPVAYQVNATKIYVGGQESLLDGSAATFTPTGDSHKLTIDVHAVAPFDKRVIGGRVYARKDGTDDPWSLLLDINLRDGVRAEMGAVYSPWVIDSGDDVKVTGIISLSLNLETYEILNGFRPDEKKITISGVGEGYKTAVVANRRCYVANVKTQNEEGVLTQMRDRIMYTPIGKFDTFPRSFFVDVVKGDAEEFIKLEEFSDRLLAFKNRKLYVINIASPSPANWYVENIKDFAGILHPYASVKTEFGICWVNDFGLYMYDGQNITNLLFNKIKESDWQSFVTEDTLIGYNPRRYYLVIMKDAFANLGDVYVYDFRVQSFVSGKSAFDDDYNRSNMVVDWNGNMTTVYQTKYFGDLEWTTAGDWDGANNNWNDTTDGYNIKEWSDTMRSITNNEFKFTTRDIDFGDPSRNKKVYGLTLTYKSDTNQTQPIYYATDGSTSFSSQLTGNFASGSGWQKLRATASTPIECQSIRFKVSNPSRPTGTTDGIQINDLSVEYRPIFKRVS